MLFGGANSSSSLSDTWEYDGTSWTNKTPATSSSPPARYYHAMAYDSGRHRTVLFGGYNTSGANFSDTWEWDGTNWTMKSQGPPPTARYQHALAYDSARGRTVLFGGVGSGGTLLSDTWEYDATTWMQTNPATPPPVHAAPALAYDSARSRTVLFGGANSSSSLSDTWEYDGTSWTNKTPATSSSPPARYFHALAYDSNRGRTVLFGGYNTSGSTFSDTWELAATSANAGKTRTANVGTPVRLDGSRSISGNSDPLAYSWARTGGSGPAVSLSAMNVTTVTFTPPVFGTYSFTLTVTDSSGLTATAPVTITANAVPTIALSPRLVGTASGAVTLSLTAAVSDIDGDTLAYAWSSSPPLAITTPGQAQPSVTVPSTNATYIVSLTVSDGRGGIATAQTTITADATAPTVTSVNYGTTVTSSGGLPVFSIPGSASITLTFNESLTEGTNTPRLDFATVAGSNAEGSATLGAGLVRVAAGIYRFQRTFTASDLGSYDFTVTASDLAGNVLTAQPLNHRFTVSAPTSTPIANPGTNQLATLGSTVQLDGSGSFETDGTIGAYAWTFSQKPPGSNAVLANASTPRPSFTADTAGSYVISLVVKDGSGTASAAAQVTITVRVDEPNTIGGVSTTLPLDGSTTAGVIDNVNDTDTGSPDRDVFGFTARVGYVYAIAIRPDPSLPITAQLQQATGSTLLPTATIAGGSSGGFAVFRPPQTETEYVTIAAADGHSSGNFTVSVVERADTAAFVPRTTLALTGTGSVQAVLSTSGTSVPISFYSARLVYDGRLLHATQATSLVTNSPFTLAQVQQLAPPDISLLFNGPTPARALLSAGLLAQLSLTSLSPVRAIDSTAVSLLEVQANASQAVLVRRPAADAGISHVVAAIANVTRVTLDGRESVDGGRQILPGAFQPGHLTYRWSQLGSLPAVVVLDNAISATPSFIPAAAGRYRFQLVVSNGVLDSPPAEVDITIRFKELEPAAQPVARDLTTGAETTPLTTALLVNIGDQVLLDGTQSIDSQTASSSGISFSWTQVAGPVTLAGFPSSARAPVAKIDTSSGLYEFELSARNAAGLVGAPARIFVVARAARSPIALALVAEQPTFGTTGPDLGDVAVLANAQSLRVSLGSLVGSTATVNLQAQVTGETAGPGKKFQFIWTQTGGPAVRLDATNRGTTDQTQDLAATVLSQPGVHEFACRVRQVDDSGNLNGIEVERKIRVLAQLNSSPLPQPTLQVSSSTKEKSTARVALKAGNALTITLPPGKITLDGSSSTAGPFASYVWTQTGGPTISLSNPLAPVTTFVTVATTAPELYAFQLVVDDGHHSEPQAAVIQIVPGSTGPQSASVPLAAGLNLISVPLEPLTLTYNVSQLLADTHGLFVVWLPTPPAANQFLPATPLLTWNDTPVSGNQGYLLKAPASGSTLSILGVPWPNSTLTRTLQPGLNLVAYPHGAPTGATAATLATTSSANFVFRLAPGADGHQHFEPYLPGLTQTPFALEAGRAYLISVPRVTTIGLGP